MQARSFGNWLKTRRKARDLTQAELADQVGCSAAAIRKFEIGWTLWQFAVTAQQMDDFVRAVRLYEAARSIFEYIGTLRPETKTQLEKRLDIYRVELGELS